MTLADLALIVAVVAAAGTLLRLVYLVARGRWKSARRTSLGLGASVIVYGLVLVSVSLLGTQRVLGMHQDRCFDDWCLAVDRVTHPREIGAVTPRGQLYLVTVRVSSRALRVPQRARDAQLYLVDANGHRYDPLPRVQRTLDTSGAGGKALNTELPPGGSFTRTVAFDLPVHAQHVGLVVTHGLFPDVVVIGDPQSWLHKPTVILL